MPQVYTNNKNGEKYQFLNRIPDCTNGREGKEIIVYLELETKKLKGREKEEFYQKFTRVKEE